MHEGTTALTAGKLQRDTLSKTLMYQMLRKSATLILRTSLIQICGITDCAPFANVQYVRKLF